MAQRPQVGFTAGEMETKHQIEAVARIALAVDLEAVDQLLHRLSWIDAVGPVVDPTAYRDVMGNIPDHRKLIRAFAAFRRELEGFRPDDEP